MRDAHTKNRTKKIKVTLGDESFRIRDVITLTSILSDIEELRHKVPRLSAVALDEEQRAAVCVCQKPHINQNLVAQHIDIQFVRDILN